MIAQVVAMTVISIFTKEDEWNMVDSGEYWQPEWHYKKYSYEIKGLDRKYSHRQIM